MRNVRLAAPWCLLIAGAIGACSEQLPRPLEKGAVRPPNEKPTGLDARPSNTTCIAGAKPPEGSTSNELIGFQRIKMNLQQPVEIVEHGGKLYVLEQAGRVVRVDDNGTTSVVLDFASKIVAGGEAGLLGIAFHPQFATNGFVFLYFTADHPVQPPPTGVVFQSIVARFHSSDGGLTLDPASEKRILTVDQPFSNHNGATIAFGNDGFLYWGLGDGGSGGDPQGNAQNPMTLLGKMVRIDVDSGDPYGIPGTNPFADGTAGSPEIYALGLRNPYRFRFDPVTGLLWAGDVGQGAREEIDKITLGGNYGWNVREGKTCYAATSCANTFLDPVVDHERSEAVTITGGVVYRGAGVPLLSGKYVYGDFGVGTLFAIPIDEAAPAPLRLDVGLERTNPGAFAIDQNGEIVFLDYYAGDIVRIIAGSPPVPAPSEMPALLSATGCVLASDPTKPARGLFPYDINVAQWADGATAERQLSIPADAVIRSDGEGRLVLPPGSVAMKTLSAEGKRIETQLLLKRPDATWSAYAYVWNPDQKDAALAEGAVTVTLPSGRKHSVVDRGQCFSCHSADVTPTIGLEAAQLDRDDVDYGGGRTGNPLATLAKLGMLDAPISPDVYAPLPGPRGFQTAELRAKGYLHANCAQCHRGGEKLIDLRFRAPLHDMHVCDVLGTSKAGGTALFVPGQPAESQLVRALQATGDGRMPPLATLLPDSEGIQNVSTWIASTTRCP